MVLAILLLSNRVFQLSEISQTESLEVEFSGKGKYERCILIAIIIAQQANDLKQAIEAENYPAAIIIGIKLVQLIKADIKCFKEGNQDGVAEELSTQCAKEHLQNSLKEIKEALFWIGSTNFQEARRKFESALSELSKAVTCKD